MANVFNPFQVASLEQHRLQQDSVLLKAQVDATLVSGRGRKKTVQK